MISLVSTYQLDLGGTFRGMDGSNGSINGSAFGKEKEHLMLFAFCMLHNEILSNAHVIGTFTAMDGYAFGKEKEHLII